MITHLFIDFDGVLTDNFVYVDEDGKESVRCNRSDGIGISKIKRLGVVPIILSSEANPVVKQRAEKLGIECQYGLSNKIAGMMMYCDNLKKAAFIGNDINDLAAMEIVGYPIAVADAYKPIKDIAVHTTLKKGGHGAVREACGWLTVKCLLTKDEVEYESN